jgi:hypothetical protein
MIIVALLAAVVTCLFPAQSGALPALTQDEQRRLDVGEIVTLDVLPPGGAAQPAQGGTVVSLVRARAEAVWQVLVDYPGHRGLYPRVVRAEVLQSDAARTLVRYVVGLGLFAFGFHVNNYADEASRRIVWRLAQDRPNDLFLDSWGYWQLDTESRGTLVTYAMAARTMLPAFLTRGAERDGLVQTIKAVRARAESRDGRPKS